jgi:hypothetical protein
MGSRKVVHLIYKFVPPDRHELVEEVKDAAVAEFRIMQLEAFRTSEEKERGVFHYHWIRFDESGDPLIRQD